MRSGQAGGTGRAEAAAKEQAEQEILQRYLPPALDDSAVAAIVDEEVARAANAGAAGPKAMGQVIKAVRERAPDADGATVAGLVKAALG